MCWLGDGQFAVMYQRSVRQTLKIYQTTKDGCKVVAKHNYKSLGHCNGLTANRKYIYAVHGHGGRCHRISLDTLKVDKKFNFKWTCGGISFDRKKKKWAYSSGAYLRITGKKIKKREPFKYQQDICHYDGYILSCISYANKKKQRIDVYKGGKFLKSIDCTIGTLEIESCCVNDKGELLMLYNSRKKKTDYIYKLKDWR